MDIISNGSTEFMEKYIFLSESYKALQGIINTLQQDVYKRQVQELGKIGETYNIGGHNEK